MLQMPCFLGQGVLGLKIGFVLEDRGEHACQCQFFGQAKVGVAEDGWQEVQRASAARTLFPTCSPAGS